MNNIFYIKFHDHRIFFIKDYLSDGKEIYKCLLCNKPFTLDYQPIKYVTPIDGCDIREMIYNFDLDLIKINKIIIKNNLSFFDFFILL
jgi:hypothetical protein